MRKYWNRTACLTITLGGLLLALGGCDPTTKLAFENGVITSSSSFLAALVQALVALAGQATTTTS
jgi:hypothetical protein